MKERTEPGSRIGAYSHVTHRMSRPGPPGRPDTQEECRMQMRPLLQVYPSTREAAGRWRTINFILKTLILLVTQDPAKLIKYSDLQ